MLAESVRWTVKQVYLAAVCFVALGCAALAAGICLQSAVAAIVPELTVNPMRLAPLPPMPPILLPTPVESTGEVARGSPVVVTSPPVDEAKRSADAIEEGLRHERADALASLSRWLIAGVIAGIIFAVHWTMFRRETTHAR